MASFNKVILMGNLTRDPEVRQGQNGSFICKLGLAVNRNYTLQNGEKKEEVTFVDVDVFGKQAEVISKYLSKGRPILIEGRLKLDQWQDKEGQSRSKLGVVCETFQFVGGGKGEGEEGGQSSGSTGNYDQRAPAPRRTAQTAPVQQPTDIDDDMPF